MRSALTLLSAVLVAGCVNATYWPRGGGAITGRWGGPHLGLTLDNKGGRLDHDCVVWTIDHPIKASANGDFVATGHYRPRIEGELGPGDAPRVYSATYSGRVITRRLLLLVVEGSAPGAARKTFFLDRSVPPALKRCI